MESRQPEMKPTPTGTAAVANGGEIRPRRYPKPPSFLRHFFSLCIRPESWAESARYPTYVTLLPLLLAILLGAVFVSAGHSCRVQQGLEQFAATYDANGYPPLVLDDKGILSAGGELKHPITLQLEDYTFQIDPTGRTKPEDIKTPGVIFVTAKEVIVIGDSGPWWRLGMESALAIGPRIELPRAGTTKVMHGETIAAWVNAQRYWLIASGVVWAMGLFVLYALWAAVVMFLICPLIMVTSSAAVRGEGGDRRLMLPRRAAYRMAAALLVPIMLVSTILPATGHSPSRLMGPEGSLLLWIFAATALAFWTGWMARQMFGPKEVRRAR